MQAFDESAHGLHPDDSELMVSGGDQHGLQDPALTHVRKMWSEDRASRSLGMKLLRLGPGEAEVSMRVREDMVNGHGMCHGGIIACLADSAFAIACNFGGTVTVAAGFDIEFLEPGQVGDELIATATERSHRGRSGIYDVTVRRVDAIVAEFRGRSRSQQRPL
jgi:acyl-CoA thioesterase